MNPRLTCRAARLWSALRETSTSRHIAGCADCQAYVRATSALDTVLRSGRAAPVSAPSPDFERTILSAIRRESASERTTAPASRWRTFGAIAAVAAVVAFGSVIFHREQTAPAITPAEATALVESVGSFSAEVVEKVIPTAGTMIAHNPLQAELTAVYADAQSALDFLALNFLPRTARDRSPATSPAQKSTG